MIIVLDELVNMDEGLKDFLCERIFEDRITSQGEIIEMAAQVGYEENEIYKGLENFFHNNLIGQVQGIVPFPVKGDFLISDSRYHEFKEKGYL